ncbi:hypothetical protein FORC087_617 (plasmid) [Bacillus cereus]|nr:hypothetical protein FORC087_617 [Bacillus cereus]
MPFQDLAAAWIVYKKAKNAQKGHSLNFFKIIPKWSIMN